MGTTLTGTTPQDTYDSLIKVTDNGPLSGTAKYLSDGLGNDSKLALSTTAVGIGTATPSVALEVDGAVKFSTSGANGPDLSFGNIGGSTFINNIAGARNYYGAYENVFTNGDNSVEFARITNTGNVGIGTSAPSQKLQVVGTVAAQIGIDGSDATGVRIYGSGTSKRVDFTAADGSVNERISGIGTGGVGIMTFSVNNNVGALTERVRIQTDGGISFNGDTAQANALDDYEEGTWTMGIAFGGASVGVTYSGTQGQYTKIGRKVTVTGQLSMTNKGSSTGAVTLTGLPFAIGASSGFYSAASIRLENITYAGFLQAFGDVTTTNVYLEQYSTLGVGGGLTNVNFANNSSILISFTYNV